MVLFGSEQECICVDEIKKLRELFKFDIGIDKVENLLSDLKESDITKQEVYMRIGAEKNKRFLSGLNEYYLAYGVRPIKVPVYERCAF